MSRKIVHLSEEQLEYIKKNYGKISVREISKRLKCSWYRVISAANRLGLKSNLKRNKDNWSTKEKLQQSGFILMENYTKSSKKHLLKCPFCQQCFYDKPSNIIYRKRRSCGCVSLGKRKGTKHISATWFDHLRNSANSRNIEFNITIGFLEELLTRQNFQCQLSGMKICVGYPKKLSDCTASLDRIDSTKPYTEDNVQFIHKDINMMKQSFSQEYFIKICKIITEHQNG